MAGLLRANDRKYEHCFNVFLIHCRSCPTFIFFFAQGFNAAHSARRDEGSLAETAGMCQTHPVSGDARVCVQTYPVSGDVCVCSRPTL